MNKLELVAQLVGKLRESALVAEREAAVAAQAAATGATAQEKREDSRVALESGGLARGQGRRAMQARMDLATAEAFHPRAHIDGEAIAVGALIEVEEEDGEIGRTLFLAPVGAGMELTMPGGDGFVSVITPGSPMGRALMGMKLGDCVEVTGGGETRYWDICWVA